MKQRILTGWNIQRVIFAAIGGILLVQSVMQREWLGIIAGVYLASMGIFALGCASGNCFGGACPSGEKNKPSPEHKT